MKNTLFVLVLASASFVGNPDSALAHHGYAAFDKETVVTLAGSVTDFHWTNPHCVVEFNVKDANGQVRKWQGEMSSPGRLGSKGWTATSLAAGDQIVISGWTGKNGIPSMWVTKIVSNGTELKLGGGQIE